MIDVIDGVRRASRLFNEPPQPQPTVAHQFEQVLESVQAINHEMRRLEARIVLLQAAVEKVEVGK